MTIFGDTLLNKVDTHMEEAIDDFVHILLDSAKCMTKRIKNRFTYSRNNLNTECRVARTNTRKALRKFRLHRSDYNRRQYCILRNQYKANCRRFKAVPKQAY